MKMRFKSLCRNAFGAALVLCLSTGCAAWAQSAASADPAPWVAQLARPAAAVDGVAGRYLPWVNSVKPDARGKVSAAEAQAWGLQLRAIADFMSASPLMQSPRGFYPSLHGFVDWLAFGPYAAVPTNAPLVGGVEMVPWLPEQIVLGPDGTARRKPGEEAESSLRLELNYVYPPAAAHWMRDAEGEFGVLDIQGHYAGFAVVGNALLITRDGRLPYAPVSQERVLRAFIGHYGGEEKRVAAEADRARAAYDTYTSAAAQAQRRSRMESELEQIRDPGNRDRQRRHLEMWERADGEKLLKLAQPDIEHEQRYAVLRAVRSAQARLAALSAAERAQPAWIRRGDVATEVPLLPAGQGVAVVAIDGQFFNPHQPRHTLRVALLRQLHVVAEGAQSVNASMHSRSTRLSLAALQQLDWPQFAQRFLK